jgi:hypothetical protein
MSATVVSEEVSVQKEVKKKPIKESDVADALLAVVGKPEGYVSCKAHHINGSWYRINMRSLKPGHTGLIKLTMVCNSYFVSFKDGKFVEGDDVINLYPNKG